MDNRKEYWNETYYDYWKNRVNEANSKKIFKSNIVVNDYKVPGDEFYEIILDEEKISNGKVLDVGCGWGRLFPIYFKRRLEVFGVDISEKMVEEARKNFPNAVISLSEAEKLPFKNGTFNFVVCFGVFDATFQNESLGEMLRVLKIGGKVLLTGKNANYFSDDKEAFAAEIGAIKKGEPNYFTDYQKLIKEITKNGHKIISTYFFKRRGDFSKKIFSKKIFEKEKFYEYLLIIQKEKNDFNFEKFYKKHSFTFYEINDE